MVDQAPDKRKVLWWIAKNPTGIVPLVEGNKKNRGILTWIGGRQSEFIEATTPEYPSNVDILSVWFGSLFQEFKCHVGFVRLDCLNKRSIEFPLDAIWIAVCHLRQNARGTYENHDE